MTIFQVLRMTDHPDVSSYVGQWYFTACCYGVSAATVTCLGDHAQGGGAAWHCGGVGG
jgi:hypothetical protein